LDVLISAATAATTGGCSLFRSATAAGLVGLAFDADDRKDYDGAQLFARTAIDG
jgi:hypothetical protein